MGTVKSSGTLSLEDDVLPNLPAAAPSDGGATIGSNAVSMSDFYESVAGGAPASGAISFSDFYSVNNQYSVGDVTVQKIVVIPPAGKDESTSTELQNTTHGGRIAYRYGNRSTATSYTEGRETLSTDKDDNITTSFFTASTSINTNTLAFHYSTYS